MLTFSKKACHELVEGVSFFFNQEKANLLEEGQLFLEEAPREIRGDM